VAQKKVNGGWLFGNGQAVQMLPLSGVRVNATAAVASTAEATLPTGARLVMVRATGPMAIRFGDTGVGAAAVDANSMLFPSGEAPVAVPLNATGTPVTHFRVIRASGSDAFVQIEGVVTLPSGI
jgi:hypothetical protein